MYSREVENEILTFGVSGKLIRNVLVMYDRETDSLWPQLLGEAIEGPLTGNKLEFLPAVHTTWAEWSTENPDTLALIKNYSGDHDRYDSYYISPQTGVIPETFNDQRLYAKEFVVGVELGENTAAYPFSVLNDEPVVNDTVNDVPLVVVFNQSSGAGTVYSREINGQTLTFDQVDQFTFVDQETGTQWNRLNGEATTGELAGEQLTAIKSTRTFWFGWKDWFPDTRLYGIDA